MCRAAALMREEPELLGTVLGGYFERSSKVFQREQNSWALCWDICLKQPPRCSKGSRALRNCVGMTETTSKVAH